MFSHQKFKTEVVLSIRETIRVISVYQVYCEKCFSLRYRVTK